MIQTPTAESPYVVCTACGRQHDLSSWQSLRLCGGGVSGSTADGQEKATHIVQSRACGCGETITVQFGLPEGTTQLQASALVALSAIG